MYYVCTLSKNDERAAALNNVSDQNDVVQIFDAAAIEAKIQD